MVEAVIEHREELKDLAESDLRSSKIAAALLEIADEREA